MVQTSKLKPTLSNSRLHAPTIPQQVTKDLSLSPEISIDKMRIVGDFNFNYLPDLLTLKDPSFDIKVADDYSYFKGFYENSKGERINFECNQKKADVTKSSNIWIEWNPNKFDYRDFVKLQDYLYKFINNAHATRIDLAFDMTEDLSSYLVYKTSAIAHRVFYGRDSSVETRYFGSPNSDSYIKIYDKKRELEHKQRIYIQQPVLWRFEVTLKTKKIHDLKNALKGISLYKPDFMQIENVQERAMLHYLTLSDDHFNHIDRKTKTKYRKMIKETQDFNLTDELVKDLKENESRLIKQINKYLILFNNCIKIVPKP